MRPQRLPGSRGTCSTTRCGPENSPTSRSAAGGSPPASTWMPSSPRTHLERDTSRRADKPAVVLPPVLRAVRPPDKGRPAGLALRPRQDLHRPPALVRAQHLGPAMPRLMPGAAHHHPSRDTPGHRLNRIAATHHPNTLTYSIFSQNKHRRPAYWWAARIRTYERSTESPAARDPHRLRRPTPAATPVLAAC